MGQTNAGYQLTVLGAGPAYTDRAGATGASYLLSASGTSLLLDLGQGSFPALAKAVEPSSLDAAVISHLHPDHFIDLVPLRHYLRYEFDPPRRVDVFGPRGLDVRLDSLHDEPGFTGQALDIHPLDDRRFKVGSFEVTPGLVTHTAESYGFRVARPGGRGLVYSGDCGRASDLLRIIEPGDVLLVEVSFGPGPVASGAQHLDGPSVGKLATEARASRVLLTHLQMGFDRAATVRSVEGWFDGPVELVDPGFTTMV